jgi:hypothetical protein
MTTARKAASIIDSGDDVTDVTPREAPSNNEPKAPSDDLGMTAVATSTTAPEEVSEGTVRMVNADGNEVDVDAADVKIHERSGWRRKEEE